ncbi:MAG: hypothetical protein E7451_06070 [Ruminococcaceae bacterium]|nr:hypothetical protein [Oscillospiraceae bacterium]
MEEPRANPDVPEEKLPPFRGLYRHVKISVKALDWVIVACIAVILIVVAFELRDPGFTVTFDSRGGTDVPAQTQMYGEHLEVPEPPTREGYEFTGWYTDASCDIPWILETRTIETDMTLYAGWEKTE